MSNLRVFCLALTFVAMLLPRLSLAQAVLAVVDQDPLTVTDVLVDKTDKNAVAAREAAIAEAQRLAFQKLAERSMAAEAFKAYKLPDSRTIMLLVRDFEIKDERLSAKRYSANFTVRFTRQAANYISVAGGNVQGHATSSTSGLNETPAQKTTLILPYLGGEGGKKTLWDDPNPWREAWQKLNTESTGVKLIVPAGDLDDVAAGDASAAWAGSYEAIEKLRKKYGADEVVLLVASRVDGDVRVERAVYRDGNLEPDLPLSFAIKAQDGEDIFQDAALQLLEKWVAPEEEGVEIMNPAMAAALPGEPVSINVVMSFGDLAQWMEAQKRMSSLTPAPRVSISSLSTNIARFLLDGNFSGGIKGLKERLSTKGIDLEPPPQAGGGPYTLTLR